MKEASVVDAGDDEPELLFLGTGSAKPSSKRGQSGILLRIGDFYALLDCGGGTWSQLVRLLGEAEAQDVVNRLSLVWLSHHHADHCAGLPTLLARRTRPGIKVVASMRITRYWRSAVELMGSCPAVAAPAISDPRRFKVPEEAGWPSAIVSVNVDHCPESYALVLRDAALQVIYSGDCRPSDSLVTVANEGTHNGLQTWLVHEATFNTDEQDNANATRHSTTLEALDVAARMRASGVLLTHFSQRYPSIELLSGSDEGASEEQAAANGSNGRKSPQIAGAAFDGLRILTTQMDAFATARKTLEDYWARRYMRGESLKKMPPLPEPRQPAPGITIARAYFKGSAATKESGPAPASVGSPIIASDASITPTSVCVPAAIRRAWEVNNPVGLSVDKLENKLHEFYSRVNPEKISDATHLARLFTKRVDLLNAKLKARYGVDLGKLGESSGTSQSSSDSEQENNLPTADDSCKKRTFNGSECRTATAATLPPSPPQAARSLSLPPQPPQPPPLPPRALGALVEQTDDKVALLPVMATTPSLPASSGGDAKVMVDMSTDSCSTLSTQGAEGSRRIQGSSSCSSSSTADPSRVSEPHIGQRARIEQSEDVMAAQETSIRPSESSSALPTVANIVAAPVGASLNGQAGPPEKRSAAALGTGSSDLLERLRTFYMKHNPERLGDAPRIARLFRGKEDFLNERLRASYNGLDLTILSLGSGCSATATPGAGAAGCQD
eukprot:TRINITY_DN27089_c0_g1_i1.p1 TRINITY_DN27089_c0_g1~~TRINITY_DN27089_c0_g1_i1.p1  ORF type:complete len:837 (+),score=135.48 TRINITY_DN27089_c0_g1_i1:328-2511(+)